MDYTEIATVSWDDVSDTLIFSAEGGHVVRFKVSIEVDGKSLVPAKWTRNHDGGCAGMADGFEVRIDIKAIPGQGNTAVASVINRTESKAKLGAFYFTAVGAIMAVSGQDLRIYKEGWCMTTPAVSGRYGDRQYLLNPDYKRFSTPDPAGYDNDIPNRHIAEYAVALNDMRSGSNLLIGFVSSDSQVTRFTIETDASGIRSLAAICEGDGIELSPGDPVTSEEMVVISGPDGYALLEKFADLWGKRMKAIGWDHTPTGWCSWPYYFQHVTEADMLENVRWLRERGDTFPIEFIQMDDGYASARGDWLICDREKFPNGLEHLATEIRDAGFKPAIWVAPFLVDEHSSLHALHPDWTVKDDRGQTVWVIPNMRGIRVAALDCSRSDVCAWLTDLFATLAGYGYEYVKLDFLAHTAGVIAMGGRYADPKVTRVQAIRRGLQAIRRGFGDDRLILGCTNVLGAGVGIVNACRIGSDFLPAWNIANEPFKEAPSLPNVLRNVINRRYLHGRLWINDPDAHLARADNNALTEDEVRMFIAASWITGGSVLSGDRFSTLSQERGELSRMLLNDLEAFDQVRPLDVFEEEYPSLWFGKSRRDPARLVIGAFNFDDEVRTLEIDLRKAGILAEAKFHAQELWSQEDLGEIHGLFAVELQPHCCKVILLAGRPVALSRSS